MKDSGYLKGKNPPKQLISRNVLHARAVSGDLEEVKWLKFNSGLNSHVLTIKLKIDYAAQ